MGMQKKRKKWAVWAIILFAGIGVCAGVGGPVIAGVSGSGVAWKAERKSGNAKPGPDVGGATSLPGEFKFYEFIGEGDRDFRATFNDGAFVIEGFNAVWGEIDYERTAFYVFKVREKLEVVGDEVMDVNRDKYTIFYNKWNEPVDEDVVGYRVEIWFVGESEAVRVYFCR